MIYQNILDRDWVSQLRDRLISISEKGNLINFIQADYTLPIKETLEIAYLNNLKHPMGEYGRAVPVKCDFYIQKSSGLTDIWCCRYSDELLSREVVEYIELIRLWSVAKGHFFFITTEEVCAIHGII